MTNIVFSSNIVRDDSSSVTDSTDGSLLEENNGVPERGIQNRFEAKRVLFSAIGKAFSSITRSVYFTGSSSAVKIEISGIEVGKNGQISNNEVEEKRQSSKFQSNPRPGNVPNHVDAELATAGWPFWLISVVGEALMGWVPRRADSFEKIDQFFTTKPYACEPSSLPQYPPSNEMVAELRDDEAKRLRAAGGKTNDGMKRTRPRDRAVRAVPAPDANAELQANVDRRRLITRANAQSKSEKFHPSRQDEALGFPLGSSHHIGPTYDPVREDDKGKNSSCSP